jgi:hypothetical protein
VARRLRVSGLDLFDLYEQPFVSVDGHQQISRDLAAPLPVRHHTYPLVFAMHPEVDANPFMLNDQELQSKTIELVRSLLRKLRQLLKTQQGRRGIQQYDHQFAHVVLEDIDQTFQRPDSELVNVIAPSVAQTVILLKALSD